MNPTRNPINCLKLLITNYDISNLQDLRISIMRFLIGRRNKRCEERDWHVPWLAAVLLSFVMAFLLFFWGGGRVSCRGFFPSCSENEVRMKSPINRQRTVKNPPEGYHHVTVLIFLFSLYHYHLVGFLFLFVSFAGIVDCYVWDFPPPLFFSLFLSSFHVSFRNDDPVLSFFHFRIEGKRERERIVSVD